MELVDKNLVVTENTSIVTRAGIKRNDTLRYTICPIREAEKPSPERMTFTRKWSFFTATPGDLSNGAS